MRTCWTAAATLALIAAADPPPVRAQVLDLPMVVEPPPLDASSYPAALIGTLEDEIARLIGAEPGTVGSARLVNRASINVRLIAADLLGAGDKAGREGSAAVVAGFRLARGRARIDGSLRNLVELGRRIDAADAPVDSATTDRFRRAVRAVETFNDLAVALAPVVRPIDEPADLDHNVAAVLAPLADAVGAIQHTAVVSHWVPAGAVPPAFAMTAAGITVAAGTAPLPESFEQLRRRLGATTMRPATRAALEIIVDRLERGAAFPDWQPYIEVYRRLVQQVLDLADALAGATWLDETSREAYAERMHLAVTLFEDKQTRDRGRRQIDRLATLQPIIDRISNLARHRVDLAPIKEAFGAAGAMIEDASTMEIPQASLARFALVLDRMIGFRELGKADLPRELATINRPLERAYLRAEKTLLDELVTLATDPRAASDPPVGTLLADQQQYLEDLERIRRVPVWVDTIRLIRPRAGGAFEAVVRKHCRRLLDPNRRPDAIRELDRFEAQLRLFYPLPLEVSLRRAEPEVILATGGLHERLVAVINDQRQAWADAWAAGKAGGDAADRLRLLARLTQTMSDTVEALRLGAEATGLNRWAAWEMAPGVLRRTMSDLPNRLKLATASAIEGDDDALRRQLDRIDRDAPLARLVGRLAFVLGDALSGLPQGAVSILGQAIHPPPPDAWMLDSRRDLTDLCRYALEREHARTTGRDELAEQLGVYVNTLAERILEVIGDGK